MAVILIYEESTKEVQDVDATEQLHQLRLKWCTFLKNSQAR